MSKFAAYDNLSIYAVAETPEDAIERGRVNTMHRNAQFKTAPISDALANHIALEGWNGRYRTFEIRSDGFLVDTTNE
jgi:hypothetical protein